VVIAPAAADALHPAFSKLFVQTEMLPEQHAILCTRRPRSAEEAVPWMLHLMRCTAPKWPGRVARDRPRAFIGRGRSTACTRRRWT
jgi:cyclic beta-1,2-glucan synthetase